MACREIIGMQDERAQDEERFRSMITLKSTAQILKLYDTATGGFNPPIKLPGSHPLRALQRKLIRKSVRPRAVRMSGSGCQGQHVSPSARCTGALSESFSAWFVGGVLVCWGA